jgi:hypothetical protein
MKKLFSTFLIIASIVLNFSCSDRSDVKNVFLEFDKSSPQAVYASTKLKEALTETGYTVNEELTDGNFTISLTIDTTSLGEEAYSLTAGKNSIEITGGDNRGMIYGSLSVTESLRNMVKISEIKSGGEKPHYLLRAIKHNTSWYSYRPSSALDQHEETLRDPKYWEGFLDMMAENRFNSLSIFNIHPFVYMITPKNFPESKSIYS